MKTPPGHLVFCIDDGYAMPLAVTLASIEATCSSDISVTVLSLGVEAESQMRLRRSAPSLEIRFTDISQLLPDDLPEMNHLSMASYGRLIAADAIDDGAKRMLYLDADLVVEDDLSLLFSQPLDGAAVAAVRDINITTVSAPGGGLEALWRSLALPPTTPYFNTGVLMIDLDEWRSSGIAQRALDIARRHGKSFKLADQDALNAVLQGAFRALPLRWNAGGALRAPAHRAYSDFLPSEVDEALTAPAIVHYSGVPKPWQLGCPDPAQDRWWAALANTPYAGASRQRPPRPPLRRRTRRALLAARRELRGF